MPPGRLVTLSQTLQREGIHSVQLAELQPELDAVESPSVLSRMTSGARAVAARQWQNVMGELHESREAATLLRRRVQGEPLSAQDTDKVRAQLGDLLRMVPASLLAVAGSAFPIPGTGLLTPWLLAKLGLMPSRWREAHLLAKLAEEELRLRDKGHHSAADQVHALASQLGDEADARELAAKNAALLTFWDANGDGQWDPEERQAYRAEITKLRQFPERDRARRQWFVQVDSQLFGPCRLTELPTLPGRALVSKGGHTGWVALHDLLSQDAPT